ncbi:hypothetical protein PI124_g22944, partial [Phytophthora idaei]
ASVYDMVKCVRADECSHRDVNHAFANLDQKKATPRDQADVHRHGLENFNDVNSRGVCIKFKEANGHDLAEIATGSMDRYVASLCLQLAPDPDAMLREAKRVLTSDGIAGFTIWGSPERSPRSGEQRAGTREHGGALQLHHGERSAGFASAVCSGWFQSRADLLRSSA